jgi:hypothetical protein
MIYKACPRCLGDLFQEDDAGYPEVVCLQCGFRTAPARRNHWEPPVANESVLQSTGGDQSFGRRPGLPRATPGSVAGSRDYPADLSQRPTRRGSTLTG